MYQVFSFPQRPKYTTRPPPYLSGDSTRGILRKVVRKRTKDGDASNAPRRYNPRWSRRAECFSCAVPLFILVHASFQSVAQRSLWDIAWTNITYLSNGRRPISIIGRSCITVLQHERQWAKEWMDRKINKWIESKRIETNHSEQKASMDNCRVEIIFCYVKCPSLYVAKYQHVLHE